MKLYYNLEDLKEILKREKNWKNGEITLHLREFQIQRQNETKAADELVKQQRNMEFQRAVTRIEDRNQPKDFGRFKKFRNAPRKDDSFSESEDSPLRTAKDVEAEEDKILQGLLNTKVIVY